MYNQCDKKEFWMDRIALFLPNLGGGGAERVMVNLARGFAKRGLKVDLVLANAEGPYLSQVPSDVRIVDLGSSRVLASFPRLVRYLRREKPGVLFSALDYANIVALWAHKLSRVPARVVVSVHCNVSQHYAKPKNLQGRLMPLLVRAFYPWANNVVAVSQGVADDLVRLTGLPKDKVQVIYNPLVSQELFVKADETLDHPWFAPGEPPVILGAGRLTEQKDFPTLIRAFALVRKKYLARLMILGEGEERPKLEHLIKELGLEDDVALPGFVENPYKYMKRAKVFVLSSAWEGFGNVLVEAMALGTPVIATDCPSGPAEILEGGKWGRLVPVGNVEALAKAISKSLKDGFSATERAKMFSVDAVIEQYLKVILGGVEKKDE